MYKYFNTERHHFCPVRSDWSCDHAYIVCTIVLWLDLIDISKLTLRIGDKNIGNLKLNKQKE